MVQSILDFRTGARHAEPDGGEKYQCRYRVPGSFHLPAIRCLIFPIRRRRLFQQHAVAPYFLDWLAHPSYDDYWKPLAIEEHFADINVPILHIAAWYDIFQGGSLRNYIGIKAHGGSEAARRGQHLLVTIGGHAGSGRKIGDVDFGPAAAEYNENDITLKWYQYLFQGAQNEFAGKPVKIFVMGTNQWREEDDWPLARAQNTKYLSSFREKRELAARRRRPLHCPASIRAFGSLRL